jgi:hypothetical protein
MDKDRIFSDAHSSMIRIDMVPDLKYWIKDPINKN